MDVFLFLTGTIGILVSISLIIYNSVKKNKTARNISTVAAICCFVLFVISIAITPSSDETSNNETYESNFVRKTSEETQKEIEASKEEQAKKDAETKASSEAAAAEKAQKEADEKAAKEAEAARIEAEKRDPNTYPTQTYDEMARNGDAHAGEKLQITGKVIQVQDGNGFASLRVATNQNGYDDIYMVQIDSADWTGHRLLEDDYVTFYGEVYGLYSYTSVLGGKITIPAMTVVFY